MPTFGKKAKKRGGVSKSCDCALCKRLTHMFLLGRLVGRLVGQLDQVVQLVKQLLAC